jgi:hypothetical protein
MQKRTSQTSADMFSLIKKLVSKERFLQAELIELLINVDQLKLYLPEYPSLFTYLTKGLGYSDSSACKRTQVVRLAAVHREVIDWIKEQKICLSHLSILAPVSKGANGKDVIMQAFGKNRRECEALACRYGAPRAPKKDKIRFVEGEETTQPIKGPEAAATSRTTTSTLFASQRVTESPLADVSFSTSAGGPLAGGPLAGGPLAELPSAEMPETPMFQSLSERVVVEFSASKEFYVKLERAKQVFANKYPNARFEHILTEALEALLDKKDPERIAERKERRIEKRKAKIAKKARQHSAENGELNVVENTITNTNTNDGPSVTEQHSRENTVKPKDKKTTNHSAPPFNASAKIKRRYIPAHIKHFVWRRDEGQCSFVLPSGGRCDERRFLEFDHIQPFALSGEHSEDNIRLLCRMHNAYRASQTYSTSTWTTQDTA